MKIKKVINFLGGPSSGKSLQAADLFVAMKKQGYSVELVTEFAKECVFERQNHILKEDQLFIFATQHRKLFRLKDTYEYVVMDSPIILSNIYYQENSFYDEDNFKGLVLNTFNNYYNYNIVLNYGNFAFEKEGRVHNLEDSQLILKSIKQYCIMNKISYNEYDVESPNFINNVIKNVTED